MLISIESRVRLAEARFLLALCQMLFASTLSKGGVQRRSIAQRVDGDLDGKRSGVGLADQRFPIGSEPACRLRCYSYLPTHRTSGGRDRPYNSS